MSPPASTYSIPGYIPDSLLFAARATIRVGWALLRGSPLYQHGVGALPGCGVEGTFETIGIPDIRGLNLHTQRTGCNFNFLQRGYVTWIGSIEKDRDTRSSSNCLLEQL